MAASDIATRAGAYAQRLIDNEYAREPEPDSGPGTEAADPEVASVA